MNEKDLIIGAKYKSLTDGDVVFTYMGKPAEFFHLSFTRAGQQRVIRLADRNVIRKDFYPFNPRKKVG